MILVGVAVLVVQLVNLQVVRASHFQKDAAQQLLENVSIPSIRGSLYDRNGQALTMSIPTRNVVVDDFQVAAKQRAAESLTLSQLLGRPASVLYRLLGMDHGYVVLAQNVGETVAAKVATDNLDGVTIVDSSIRVDPDGPLAETVLGGTNVGRGAAGLEYQYGSLLAGKTGEAREFVSPYGVMLPNTQPVITGHPVPGTSLELTLDAPLQYVTEQALGQELAASNGLTGVAIVLDTRTGQVLSMASLENRAQDSSSLPAPLHEPKAWPTPTGIPKVYETQNNLAVTNSYEPGSVFKIVPFSAALLNHVITPDTRFAVPDYVTIDGDVFHDAEQHGLEHLTATQVLEYSSNIGTYEISNALGES
ncbi:MAG TPA: penicillin-binding transpeptidase domain-containing protein, partial [Acidimicrobiales bacterium]|nr:penicillin-binding transpeptidase domain-containing protein [Acidimicrobiales bacterium]